MLDITTINGGITRFMVEQSHCLEPSCVEFIDSRVTKTAVNGGDQLVDIYFCNWRINYKSRHFYSSKRNTILNGFTDNFRSAIGEEKWVAYLTRVQVNRYWLIWAPSPPANNILQTCTHFDNSNLSPQAAQRLWPWKLKSLRTLKSVRSVHLIKSELRPKKWGTFIT